MPTDWEKLKVAELKEECRNREISMTGLKLKQQYIDKLVEHETQQEGTQADEQDEATQKEVEVNPPVRTSEQPEPTQDGSGQGEGVSVADRTNEMIEDMPEEQPAVSEEENKPLSAAQVEEAGAIEEVMKPVDDEEQQPPDIVEADPPLAAETDEALPDDRPAALKVEDDQVLAAEAEVTPQEDVPMAETVQQAKDIKDEDMLEPQDEQLQPVVQDPEVTAEEQEVKEQELKEALQPEQTRIVDTNATADESTTSTSTPADDSRKRKRRSLTPPPDSQEIAKKAKTLDGGSVPTKRPSVSPARSPLKSEPDTLRETLTKQDPDEISEQDKHKRERSTSYDKESTVEPAIHHATRSLYMKNFKRPFAIALLREHIETIARGSSVLKPDEKPIQFYNLNALRSHVFVKFSSISIASRVRAEMHGKKFPNDGSPRDEIWVDFVPDDKVEQWVEFEQSRDRRNNTKVEVQYTKNKDGVMEASFDEVSLSTRQSIGGKRDSIAQRQPSYTADPTRITAIASGTGVHPDRAGIVPRSPEDRRRPSARDIPSPQRSRRKDTGIGFAGLDDLFESTSTKPKLYYKLPSQKVVDDRLDLIADLYSDRGVPGAPGMKRYTFEKDGGRDMWVDNGPEFGHGKKGQDRLNGIPNRGRGGYRGGRGTYRGYGGRERDIYRGEGRR